jgi:hypothetical protein
VLLGEGSQQNEPERGAPAEEADDHEVLSDIDIEMRARQI